MLQNLNATVNGGLILLNLEVLALQNLGPSFTSGDGNKFLQNLGPSFTSGDIVSGDGNKFL